MPDYFWYTRETTMKNFTLFYAAELIWSILAAAIQFYISSYTIGGVLK